MKLPPAGSPSLETRGCEKPTNHSCPIPYNTNHSPAVKPRSGCRHPYPETRGPKTRGPVTREPATPHSLLRLCDHSGPRRVCTHAATGGQCCLWLSHPHLVSTQPPPQPTTNWQWVTAATLRSSRAAPVTCAAAPARTLSTLLHQDARRCRGEPRPHRCLPIGCRSS